MKLILIDELQLRETILLALYAGPQASQVTEENQEANWLNEARKRYQTDASFAHAVDAYMTRACKEMEPCQATSDSGR